MKRGRKWDIEYGGYLSNHITHNWIALDAAGVDQEKMDWWEKLYTNEMESSPAREPGDLEPPRDAPATCTEITEANWRNNLQSTRVAFPLYRDFFDRQIAELGLSDCLNTYFPILAEGLAGAAFHAVIHLGWAVDVESEDMAAEGLAYMATAFQPLATGGHHKSSLLWSDKANKPIESLKKALTDPRVPEFTKLCDDLSKTEAYEKLNRGGFQHRMIAFDQADEPLASFLNEVATLYFPEQGNNIQPIIEELMVIVASALRASKNEFFILHALTSLHGILAILPHLSDDAQRDTLAYWWRAMIATMIVQNAPGGDDAITLLEGWRESTNKKELTPYELSSGEKAWWLETLKSTTGSLDEHVPKSIYVLKRWSEWQAFSEQSYQALTATARGVVAPNIEDEPHENLWFSNAFSQSSEEKHKRYD